MSTDPSTPLSPDAASTRRDFLKLLALSAAGAALPALGRGPLFAAGKKTEKLPDLVGVKDGAPAQMFDAGIGALGGLSRFVKRGKTVLVKPNIGWSKTPNEGATTNPELVGRIVEGAYAAGAKKVFVFDHTVNDEETCYESSGIRKAVLDKGGEMRSGSDKSMYRKVRVEGGEVLTDVLVHELYLDCDVVVNVPILKSHGGGRLTAALKNLMGVVWDRREWHLKGLHQAIAEFPKVRKPDLNVVDAYLVMVENGPRGHSTEDLSLKKMQLLSPDAVLVDAAAAKVLDMKPEDVAHIKLAAGLGVGSMDLDKALVKRVSLKP